MSFLRLLETTGIFIDVEKLFFMSTPNLTIKNITAIIVFISKKFFVCKCLLLAAIFFVFSCYYLLKMISYQIVFVTLFVLEMQ